VKRGENLNMVKENSFTQMEVIMRDLGRIIK
jgi:hypothetical protein